MKTLFFITITFFAAFSSTVNSAEYSCKVERKFDNDRQYTSEQLAKGQFAVLLQEKNTEVFVSRCSFAQSAGKVTCDRYKVEKVVSDEYIKAKKFYVFQSQFDFQLFSDFSFLENNGRGGVSYGKCALTEL